MTPDASTAFPFSRKWKDSNDVSLEWKLRRVGRCPSIPVKAGAHSHFWGDGWCHEVKTAASMLF
jgi:hypothetical protein